jgi:hypothetical protein
MLYFVRTSVLKTDVPPVMPAQENFCLTDEYTGPGTLLEAHSYTGISTKVIQSTPRVVPTVPPVLLVDKHSDCQNLPSINGSVGGMGIPTKGVESTLLSPQVGASSGLDKGRRSLHHVTDHSRAGSRNKQKLSVSGPRNSTFLKISGPRNKQSHFDYLWLQKSSEMVHF